MYTMASARNSPGPHDRDPATPRQRCIRLVYDVKISGSRRCKFFATRGTKLCRKHKAEAEGRSLETNPTLRLAKEARSARGEVTKTVKKTAFSKKKPVNQSDTDFVVSEQSKMALKRLHMPLDRGLDPKVVLLDSVRSSWEQRKVWEGMLASVPPEDFEQLGVIPMPGVSTGHKGARIEAIQKFLAESTKNAARISKLAIDAGIEERLVRLAEEQSALIADTVRAGVIAGIAALEASGVIKPAAAKIAQEAAISSAAQHLRQLAARQAGEEPEPTYTPRGSRRAPDEVIIEGSAEAIKEF